MEETPAPATPVILGTGDHSTTTPAATILTLLTTTPSQHFPAGAPVDDGPFEAILGGCIAAILLLLCCAAFLVLRYMFNNKGSYVTYEAGDGESMDMETADDE